MEFSWNYSEVMRRLATESCFFNSQSVGLDAKESLAYAAMVKFDLSREECEIPTMVVDRLLGHIQSVPEEVTEIVMPLFKGSWERSCAGAETMLKYFLRENTGRLNKAVTPKGEIYYGNNGIILDSEFNPLLLTTVKVRFEPTQYRRITKLGYIVYMHPNVFINDEKVLNKSLAKKGIAYYLSHPVSNSWLETTLNYKVVIDDCSKFIVKAHRPDVNNCSSETFTEVLKENIDEVLGQVAYDIG